VGRRQIISFEFNLRAEWGQGERCCALALCTLYEIGAI
jgi:hypothetical protein